MFKIRKAKNEEPTAQGQGKYCEFEKQPLNVINTNKHVFHQSKSKTMIYLNY